MASSVTVHIVNIQVNTVNLGFASGNSIFLMLAICSVTLEAMQYLYNIKFFLNCIEEHLQLKCFNDHETILLNIVGFILYNISILKVVSHKGH